MKKTILIVKKLAFAVTNLVVALPVAMMIMVAISHVICIIPYEYVWWRLALMIVLTFTVGIDLILCFDMNYVAILSRMKWVRDAIGENEPIKFIGYRSVFGNIYKELRDIK